MLFDFMANVSKQNVVDYVVAGIKKATKDYSRVTKSFHPLGYGPEYYLSVSIANSLKSGLNGALIFLEENWKDSVESPERKRKGNWHPNYRYDIVVRGSDRIEYAAIEVKHRIKSVTKWVIKDFDRITEAVKLEDGENRFKMGIFAFYTQKRGKENDEKKLGREISERYEKLENALKMQKKKANLSKSLIPPQLYKDGDGKLIRGAENSVFVWGGGCFILTPE